MSSETTTNIRHELRTPINHIVGYSELMMEDYNGGSDQERATLQKLHAGGQRLAKLVEQLVATDRATGRPVLADGPATEFSAVIEEIRADLTLMNSACAGKPEARDLVKIDSAVTRLSQILQEIRSTPA